MLCLRPHRRKKTDIPIEHMNLRIPPQKKAFLIKKSNLKKHKMKNPLSRGKGIKTIKIVLRLMGETFWILSQTLSAPLPMFTRKKNRNQIDYLKTRNFGKEERRNLSLLAPLLSSTKSCSAFLFN